METEVGNVETVSSSPDSWPIIDRGGLNRRII